VRLTSPSRRAAGLLAASTIGLSTAVLSVTGVASAVTQAPVTSATHSSASAAGGDTGIPIPDGYCYAYVQVTGGQGGGSGPAAGGPAGEVSFEMPVTGGQEFTFVRGAAGTDTFPVPSGSGAASQLLLGTHVVAEAAGGDGANGGAAGAGSNAIDPAYVLEDSNSFQGSSADSEQGSGWEGPGEVFVNAFGCDAPYAPSIDSVTPGDVSATVTFYPEEGDAYTAAASGYEYTVDGTTWKSVTPTASETAGALEFQVSGLTNGQAYPVQVRATSEFNGVSDASDAESVTPFVAIGAPTITSVKASASSVTVTWTAPTLAGTYGLAGYDVGYSGGEWGNQACATDATVLTCTFGVPAGADYLVSVFAVDSAGHSGTPARVQSGVVVAPAIPSAVPTKDDGDITGANGPISKVTAGQKLTLKGSGFAPNSTVRLTVFSTPVDLGTTVVDGSGAFSIQVTIPAGLANGTHHLVASGVDANGNVRNLVTEVTLSGGTPSLAYTGFSPMPYIGGGLVALLAGAGLLVASRRRAG
jgi:hypothetical protein